MKRLLASVLLLAVCLTSFGFTEGHAASVIATSEITSTELDNVTNFPTLPEESEVPISPAATNATAVKSRTSQAMIDFIKSYEGFHSKPYWDYSQWTVGYGTCCRNDKGERCTNPNNEAEIAARYRNVSKETAEQLLREELARDYEVSVSRYEKNHNLSFNQHEFDALVSFTFNLGAGWTYGGYKINAYLENPDPNKPHIDLVRAMGAWCRVGGEVSPGIARRRLSEAQVFLYGDYKGNASTHPNYRYVIYDGNGSLLSKYYTDDIDFFKVGKPYGKLLSPKWDSAEDASMAALSEEELLDAKAAIPFTDVPKGKWYYDSVVTVYNKGLMNGVTNTIFRPSGSLTRGQLVTMLYRLEESPEVSGSSGFRDVPDGKYYTKAVIWANKNHIVDGTGGGMFSPEKNITREQIATIFCRYYKYKGHDVSHRANLGLYVDVNNVSKYAYDAMSWAVYENLLLGISNPGQPTKLKPKDLCTRAQAAVLLVRMMDLLEHGVISPGSPLFAGWFNSNGEQITDSTIVKENQIVTAKWVKY